MQVSALTKNNNVPADSDNYTIKPWMKPTAKIVNQQPDAVVEENETVFAQFNSSFELGKFLNWFNPSKFAIEGYAGEFASAASAWHFVMFVDQDGNCDDRLRRTTGRDIGQYVREARLRLDETSHAVGLAVARIALIEVAYANKGQFIKACEDWMERTGYDLDDIIVKVPAQRSIGTATWTSVCEELIPELYQQLRGLDEDESDDLVKRRALVAFEKTLKSDRCAGFISKAKAKAAELGLTEANMTLGQLVTMINNHNVDFVNRAYLLTNSFAEGAVYEVQDVLLALHLTNFHHRQVAFTVAEAEAEGVVYNKDDILAYIESESAKTTLTGIHTWQEGDNPLEVAGIATELVSYRGQPSPRLSEEANEYLERVAKSDLIQLGAGVTGCTRPRRYASSIMNHSDRAVGSTATGDAVLAECQELAVAYIMGWKNPGEDVDATFAEEIASMVPQNVVNDDGRKTKSQLIDDVTGWSTPSGVIKYIEAKQEYEAQQRRHAKPRGGQMREAFDNARGGARKGRR